MPKIAFIGAGSFEFTRNLARDLLSYPALAGSDLYLMDIDRERLGYIERSVTRLVRAGGYPARIKATTDRVEALEGADGVVCTILQGGVQVWRHDIEIPKRHGVDLNVGDTRGPAGIFRALRTIPLMLEIGKDMEKHCPGATLLNYTNPMAMICRALQAYIGIRATGLCHSVQGTAEMLARWIGAPPGEISYLCAGINHQAWFLRFLWKGKDAYPLVRRALEQPEIFNEEQVRNEMFLHLDYYVTESSGHNSEYNPWFRKRPDLLERYCTHGTGWNPGRYGYILDTYLERERTWKSDIEAELSSPVDLARGREYAAGIFNALFGDGTLCKFNGNVRNLGIIDNLPAGCCVEVPVLASPFGLEPLRVGALPAHLAALNALNATSEELAVEGAVEGDRRKVFHAVALDPLSSAVLSLEEIHDLVDEMFAQNRDWLPRFRTA